MTNRQRWVLDLALCLAVLGTIFMLACGSDTHRVTNVLPHLPDPVCSDFKGHGPDRPINEVPEPKTICHIKGDCFYNCPEADAEAEAFEGRNLVPCFPFDGIGPVKKNDPRNLPGRWCIIDDVCYYGCP